MLKLHNRSQAPPPTATAPDPAPAAPSRTPPRTRAGTTWVLVCIAALVLIALIVFIAQNSGATEISFFSLHGRFPLAVALLAAALAGCILTLVIGSTRIFQLRRAVRSGSRDTAAAQAAAAAAPPQTPGTAPDAPLARGPEPGRADAAAGNGKLEG